MCYMSFDRASHKPMIADCGHTICDLCISRIDKCCICKRRFSGQVGRNLPAIAQEIYGMHYPPHLNISRRQSRLNPLHDYHFDGINVLPRESQVGFRENYALLDMIEKHTRDYDLCPTSQEYNEFYCTECKSLVCVSCIDTDHENHALRRLSVPMHKLTKSIVELQDNFKTWSFDVSECAAVVKEATDKNRSAEQDLAYKIDSLYEEIIVRVVESRDYIQEMLANSLEHKKELIKEAQDKIINIRKDFETLEEQLDNLNTEVIDTGYTKDLNQIVQFEILKQQATTLGPRSKAEQIYGQRKSDLEVPDYAENVRSICRDFIAKLPRDLKAKTNPFCEDEPSIEVSEVLGGSAAEKDDPFDEIHPFAAFRARHIDSSGLDESHNISYPDLYGLEDSLAEIRRRLPIRRRHPVNSQEDLNLDVLE